MIHLKRAEMKNIYFGFKIYIYTVSVALCTVRLLRQSSECGKFSRNTLMEVTCIVTKYAGLWRKGKSHSLPVGEYISAVAYEP